MNTCSERKLVFLVCCPILLVMFLLAARPAVHAELFHPDTVTPTPRLPDVFIPPTLAADGNENGKPASQHAPIGSAVGGRAVSSPQDEIYIWPPAEDALVYSGAPDSNYGSDHNLWAADALRSLIRWDLSSLPDRTMIYYSDASIRLVDGWGPDMNVSAHNLTDSWTENEVTWNRRDGTNDWSTPGGDFDSFAEDVVSVGTVTNTLYAWTLTDLVAEWHSGKQANYGILLQPESYPASSTKIFGSKEDSGYKPELDVYYILGPVSLSTYVPFTWGVPSPDWYSLSRGSYWNAVAIRPPTGSDYDLGLSSTDGYTDTLASSTYGSAEVDFVLVDGNHAPAGDYYPMVNQFSGRGQYWIEHATHTADLLPGTHGPYAIGADEVVRVWDADLSNGATYYFAVCPITGDADLGVSLHKSNGADPSTCYQSRWQAVAQADDASAGETEYLVHVASESDWYGLAVWSKGATVTTTYTVYMDTTAPTGTISIAGSATYANTTSVTLNLNGVDNETGVSSMRFSNSGSPTGNWTDYSSTYPWTLTAGDGMKTVYAQFANNVNVVSDVYSDTITLDQTPPSSNASSPDYSNAANIPVTWSASDGLSGVASTSLWYQLSTGGSWTDSGLTQSGTTGTFNFTPPSGSNGTYYFATRAADNTTNIEGAPSGNGDDATIYDTVPPTVSISCASEIDETSYTVSWAGSDSTSGIATYDVQYRVGAGGIWTTWMEGTTATSATFGPTDPVTVEKDQAYSFRAHAQDRAGNIGQYAAGDCPVYVGGEYLVFLPLVVRNYVTYAGPCGPGNNYCEDYDTWENAYGPLEPAVSYRAYPNDQNDYYYFVLFNTGAVTIRVTDYQAVGQVIVRDEATSEKGKDEEKAGGDGVMEVSISSLLPGKYYIQLYTAPGYENSNDLYTLTVTY